MEKKLLDFLNSPNDRAWLTTQRIAAYVRKSRRLGINGEMHSYLDIASVAVPPLLRRKGRFKDFLCLCQRLQPYDGLFIENVHSPELRAYLRRLALEDGRWFERELDFFWQK